jgi:hypothetical protein
MRRGAVGVHTCETISGERISVLDKIAVVEFSCFNNLELIDSIFVLKPTKAFIISVSEKSFLLPDEVDFIGDIFVFMIVR